MKHACLLVLSFTILATACQKTGQFYDQLDNLPRANQLAGNSYAVGDTLVLTGKFGAGKADLKISIGGVDASVISLVSRDSSYTQNDVLYNYTLDVAKVLITTPMIGQQQPVIVSVNGIGSTVAAILVSKDKLVPARTDTLTYLDPAVAKEALRMPAGTRIVPNYTPGAAIVFMSGDSLVTWQEGNIRRGKVTWEDNYGPFTLIDPSSEHFGFGSDPAGNNLYISCLTRDARLPGTNQSAIRLMKVSLRDYSVTTLNRTVIPTDASFIDEAYYDLDTVKKEGNISQVFLPVMKNIYANSKGELYFSGPALNWIATTGKASPSIQSNLTLAGMDASGTFRYLAKASNNSRQFFVVRTRKGGRINGAYDFIPNITTVLNYNRLLGIDAENDLLYGYTVTSLGATSYTISTFYCYNLAQQRQFGEFTYKLNNQVPTITDGPFDVVEGNYTETSGTGARIFQWPAPGLPGVLFATQQQDMQDGLRSIKMVNFNNRTVSTYAPFIQGYSPGSKYRLGIGGDVVGYTASKQPLMVRTNETDVTINEVLLMAPVQ
ncbi:hypothetical protein [Chitinophaga barathri]|uniref:IPT/TIG domain-containing protein n=1 Tax=Chitinophaga barathri TaxID=1647451 RepID=A0A3N4MBZ9_9BACT|nr:hypothetical protein [Chitinophaga barathri]RPD41181.1 hypothetical protein EG028_10895 [Chitinophaga barathri]